jgi:ribose transport system permease protein
LISKENIRKFSLIKLSSKFYNNPSFTSFIVLIILIIVNAVLQPRFFRYEIIKSNFMSFTPLILVSMAQGVIIISGSIDLSVGAAMSFYTIIAASLMSDSIVNLIIVVLLGIVITMLFGGFNGALIGVLRLPSFITTYATSGIVLGTSIIIMPVPGGYVPKFFYRLYRGDILGFIPTPIFILIIGLTVWGLVSKTIFYRHIYAIGGNETGAYASNIKVSKVRLLAHLFAGFFVGLAGLCLLLLTAAGEYRAGIAYSLNSIAAVVIGGISLTGGRGNIWGAIFGALILSLLNNIIFFAQVPSFYQEFARGMIVILSLSLATIPRLREIRSF